MFPIDNKAKGGMPTGGSASIITTKDPAETEGGVGIRQVRDRPRGAEDRRRDRPGYLPTNLRAPGPEYPRAVLRRQSELPTPPVQIERALPWQGYPGGNSVRIWRTQREIIIGVMRGEIAPEAGLERLVKETNALLK